MSRPGDGTAYSSEAGELERRCAGLVREYNETNEVRKRNSLSVRLEAMPQNLRRRVCELASFYELDSDESPDPEPHIYVTLRINRHRPPAMPTLSLTTAARRLAQERATAAAAGAGTDADADAGAGAGAGVGGRSGTGLAGSGDDDADAWSCDQCTLLNERRHNTCAACGAERPSSDPSYPSEPSLGGGKAWSCPSTPSGGNAHVAGEAGGDAGSNPGAYAGGAHAAPAPKYKHSVLKINRPVQAAAEEPEPVELQVEPAKLPQTEVGGSTQFSLLAALEDEDDDVVLAALQPKEIAVDEVCCICLDELQTVERATRGEELSVYEACKHAIHASCAKQLRAAQVASKQADGEGHTGGTTMLEIELGAHGSFTCPLCRTVSRGFVDVTLRTSAVRRTKGR